MRVLLVEAESGAGRDAESELVAAGHTVVRCVDAGEAAFPCAGTDVGPGCPLDEAPVDVAVAVAARAHQRSEPVAREMGAVCALRRHIPLATVGSLEHSPFQGFATAVALGPETAVAAATAAARQPLPVHSQAARDALVGVLLRHGLGDVRADAWAERVAGGVRLTLVTDVEVSRSVASMAAVRAITAVRAVDDDASHIDVGWRSSGGADSN